MREFKLRLWNPERKVLTAGTELNTLLLTTDGNFVKEFKRCGTVWMQFTGLLDKNRKEIFEGDLIRIEKLECIGHDSNDNEIWESDYGPVLFEDGMFVFEGRSAGTLPLYAYMGDLEVIGNIYETKPETI